MSSALPLQWCTDIPYMGGSVAPFREKLQHLHELVQEQLHLQQTEPSTRPWKAPIFVIPNKFGK